MESGRLLAAIIDHAIDGIITIDNRGNVESINPAALELFGYEADEVIGHNVSMLMPERDRSNHDGYIHNYQTTGQKKIIGIGREVMGLKKNGETFPFRLAVSEVWLKDKNIFTGLFTICPAKKPLKICSNSMQRNWNIRLVNVPGT